MWESIILLGAPGSGKGTTASDLIEAAPRFTHVSTGDMLREALQSGSAVGLEAKSYMEKGALVPDEVIMKIVRERLLAGDKDASYLFDGFPRTLNQAQLLDSLFSEEDQGRLSHVVLLEVPREVLIDRIAGRLICKDCGKVYHIRNLPPSKEGICDVCGGELYQRADDNSETVANRLDVYEKQTASLINYYEEQGVLRRVIGRSREETLKAVLAAIAES